MKSSDSTDRTYSYRNLLAYFEAVFLTVCTTGLAIGWLLEAVRDRTPRSILVFVLVLLLMIPFAAYAPWIWRFIFANERIRVEEEGGIHWMRGRESITITPDELDRIEYRMLSPIPSWVIFAKDGRTIRFNSRIGSYLALDDQLRRLKSTWARRKAI